MKQTKILLVDNEVLLLESLTLILSAQSSFEVTAAARDGREALEKLKTTTADIALVDLNMEGMGGQELIVHLRNNHPRIKIIVLTTFYDETNIIKAIKNGAFGYLLKDSGPQVIINAINQVSSGQSILDEKVLRALALAVNNRGKNEEYKDTFFENFTNREKEICEMIAEGYTNSQIAKFLYLSEGTVKNHISSIYDKSGINDRVQLALKLARLYER